MGATREARALILLVLLDEKPVAVFDIDENRVGEVLNKSESIGLSIKIAKEVKAGENVKYQMAVSKSPDLVNEMKEIIEKDISELNDKRLGELMGYPKTAIDAYVSKDESKQTSFDEYLETTKEYRELFGFRISKEHAEEEKSVLNRWHNLILQYAPELLKKNDNQPE